MLLTVFFVFFVFFAVVTAGGGGHWNSGMVALAEPMRIVDSLRGNYGGAASSSTAGSSHTAGGFGNDVVLVADVPAVAYKGPSSFHTLKGQCFSSVIHPYRYEVCPFDNVTQHDMLVSWDAYHGVLGSYAGWVLEGDAMVGTAYLNGADCHGSPRQANITFSCRNVTEVVSITEPAVCRYLVDLSTPLACGTELNLANFLSGEGAERLRVSEDEHFNAELTTRGYHYMARYLAEEEEGLLAKMPAAHAQPASNSPRPAETDGSFHLPQSQAYPFHHPLYLGFYHHLLRHSGDGNGQLDIFTRNEPVVANSGEPHGEEERESGAEEASSDLGEQGESDGLADAILALLRRIGTINASIETAAEGDKEGARGNDSASGEKGAGVEELLGTPRGQRVAVLDALQAAFDELDDSLKTDALRNILATVRAEAIDI